MSELPLLVSNPTQQPWFWELADVTVGILLALNLLVLAFVYLRRARQKIRARRSEGFKARFESIVEAVVSGTAGPDHEQLRKQVTRLNELERPIAASLLLERLRPASPEERRRICELLRPTGTIELLLRGTRRHRPWRRALAIRTLGYLGEPQAVPVVLERLADRNRYVRDASVRALGRIGDRRALPALERLFLDPGREVASGFVYEGVVAYGEDAAPIFRQGLRSDDEQVRVSSCFGIGSVLPPERARPLLEAMLDDRSPAVRAASLEVLGRIGGAQVPDELARCSRDYQRSVRRAAASALGAYDDPRAVQLLLGVLLDPDRDAVIRAGESLVRLSRLPRVGEQAREQTERSDAWPLERARILAALGAV